MDKEIVLSLINAVKTQKNIMIKHIETFRNDLDVRSMFMMNRILYQRERFKKNNSKYKFINEKIS